jgi:Ca2+-binding RTX toxin-like protein
MRVLLCGALVAAFGWIATAAPARPDPSKCKNVITGTALPDSLDGTPGNDKILGLGGDDLLKGEGGNDCLYGGFDSDQLIGGSGDDLLVGGNGSDILEGDAGADDLIGQQDADRLDGGPGNDRLSGGGSADVLLGGPGADILRGQGGNDRLAGGPGPDVLLGGPGNDTIDEVPSAYAPGTLDSGSNRIDGGSGRDRIDVANGRRDRVDCGGGRDTVKADRFDRLKHCEKRRYLISPFPAVAPGRGGPTRAFLVKFRSIQKVGPRADWFTIRVKGPRGCGMLEATSEGATYHADRAVRYRLRPFHGNGRMAKRWCDGLYRGTVSYARPAAKEVRIGSFSFRVRG